MNKMKGSLLVLANCNKSFKIYVLLCLFSNCKFEDDSQAPLRFRDSKGEKCCLPALLALLIHVFLMSWL